MSCVLPAEQLHGAGIVDLAWSAAVESVLPRGKRSKKYGVPLVIVYAVGA